MRILAPGSGSVETRYFPEGGFDCSTYGGWCWESTDHRGKPGVVTGSQGRRAWMRFRGGLSWGRQGWRTVPQEVLGGGQENSREKPASASSFEQLARQSSQEGVEAGGNHFLHSKGDRERQKDPHQLMGVLPASVWGQGCCSTPPS